MKARAQQIIRWLVRGGGLTGMLWTVAVSILIPFLPGRGEYSQSIALPDGTIMSQSGAYSKSLLQREGWFSVFGYLLWPFLLPTMIAISAFRAAWLHRQRLLWILALTMCLFCFLSGFSIGRGYIPAAYAFLIAAILNTFYIKRKRR